MRTSARTDRDANHDLAVIPVRVLDDAARDLERLAELTQPCREWLARSRWPLRQPLLRSTEACAGRRFCPPATTRLGLPRLRVA
jgi:hypothetical protein